MIFAEWRHDMEGALQLALSSLPHFNNDGDAFLITEVTGRQLAYAGRKSEAIEWLERAHAHTISEHEVWRRNVMITLAELVGKEDSARAVALTHEAVLLSRTTLLGERLAESCAEESIALWSANDRKGAFNSLQLAVREALTAESDTTTWKELFLSLFRVVSYFGSIAHKSLSSGWHRRANAGDVSRHGRFGYDQVLSCPEELHSDLDGHVWRGSPRVFGRGSVVPGRNAARRDVSSRSEYLFVRRILGRVSAAAGLLPGIADEHQNGDKDRQRTGDGESRFVAFHSITSEKHLNSVVRRNARVGTRT